MNLIATHLMLRGRVMIVCELRVYHIVSSISPTPNFAKTRRLIKSHLKRWFKNVDSKNQMKNSGNAQQPQVFYQPQHVVAMKQLTRQQNLNAGLLGINYYVLTVFIKKEAASAAFSLHLAFCNYVILVRRCEPFWIDIAWILIGLNPYCLDGMDG